MKLFASSGWSDKSVLKGDINGGLIAGVLSLPEAIAFGAVVFGALGPEYLSFGVVAGLTGLALSNIVGAKFGSIRIMTTGPYSLSSLMLASALAVLMEKDVVINSSDPASTALHLLLLVMFVAGLLQCLFGLLKLGDLAKYIPYPVIGGLMNGIAILIVVGQIRPLLGLARDAPLSDFGYVFANAQPLTLIVGLVTTATVFMAPKWNRKIPGADIPGPVYGIVAGTLIYYLLKAAGLNAHLGPIIGDIPMSFPLPTHSDDLFMLFWQGKAFPVLLDVIGLSLAVALVISLRTLLGVVTINNVTQERYDTSRELYAQGIGNMCAPLFGGLISSGYSAQSIANHQNGGTTRLSRLIVGLFALAILLFLGPLVGRVPQVILAGILLPMAYYAIDKWSVNQLIAPFSKKKISRDSALDIIILVTVTGVMVGVGIFEGVGVGVLISAIVFVYRMSRNTIRRQYNGQRIRSNVERQLDEILLLEEHGDKIEVFELEGSLFFGTTDILASAIEKILESETKYIIIDFKRINDVDSTGAKILVQLNERATQHGKSVFLSSINLDSEFGKLIEGLGLTENFGKEICFSSINRALATAEDFILDDLIGSDRYDSGCELKQVDAFSEMSPGQIKVFSEYCDKVEYPMGEVLFEQDTPGNEVFFIVSGRINIFTQSKIKGDRERLLVTLCPGTICGEMAVLDGKPRVAKAVAERNLVCYRLNLENLARLQDEHPKLSFLFIKGLSRELAKRIRIANRSKTELQG